MNIYREVVNRIEIPALPSLENGYYLLRFERNGTTSNVYAVVENESGMGVPITASVTEIGTGTPDPESGEVLLAPGAWTLFFYEQVSGTNTNPDCSTIPLGQTEVTVYGEDAAVLSQTPTACPSGPGGGITSVNSDTGPAVQLDAVDIPSTPFVSLQAGTFPGAYRATGLTGDGEPWYKLAGAAGPIDDGNNSIFYQGSNFWEISNATGLVMYQGTGADLLTATWTNTVDGALPLPSLVGIEADDVQAAVEEVAAIAADMPTIAYQGTVVPGLVFGVRTATTDGSGEVVFNLLDVSPNIQQITLISGRARVVAGLTPYVTDDSPGSYTVVFKDLAGLPITSEDVIVTFTYKP